VTDGDETPDAISPSPRPRDPSPLPPPAPGAPLFDQDLADRTVTPVPIAESLKSLKRKRPGAARSAAVTGAATPAPTDGGTAPVPQAEPLPGADAQGAEALPGVEPLRGADGAGPSAGDAGAQDVAAEPASPAPAAETAATAALAPVSPAPVAVDAVAVARGAPSTGSPPYADPPSTPMSRAAATVATVGGRDDPDLAHLGEYGARRLDRRAVVIDRRRIGKLEPDWGRLRRLRSLLVLIILVTLVAVVMATALALIVEAISVAANHAISSNSGG